ncbi:MAG: hypothetical protein M3Y08_07595 [Fibrobacterota bacterium]|nr:hypothetical protein [Fibrobacterota bacterium]
MTLKMEERLWITAQYLARESNMDYSVPCATVVRDFVRAGTHNMIREKRTSEHDFEEADANLSRLVKKMVEAAHALPNPRASLPGPVLIREAAFVTAKEMCPLWPFC